MNCQRLLCRRNFFRLPSFPTRSILALVLSCGLLLVTGQPTLAQTAADQLRQSLQDATPQTRMEAIAKSVERPLSDNEQAAVLTQLMQALDDDIPDVRGLAAEAIATFGPNAEPAIPKLISKLSDQGIKMDLKGVWVPCSQALGKIGPAAIQPMLAAIDGSDQLTYYGVMGALSEMQAGASEVVPTLIDLLREGPEDRRWATMYALSGIGAAARPAVDLLVKQLDDEDFNIQCIACRALAAIGPPAKPAVPKLLHLIENGIISARGQAAICLGAVGPVDDVDSVGILVKLLKANDQITRERALIGLGHLGPAAVEARPTVEQALHDSDFWPKPEASRTLWLISGDASQSVPKLIELMESPDHDIRAMEVLAEIGPQAVEAAEALASKLDSEDQGIRLLAAKGLRSIGPGARAHREALAARLEDSDPDVVEVLKEAISRMSSEGDN